MLSPPKKKQVKIPFQIIIFRALNDEQWQNQNKLVCVFGPPVSHLNLIYCTNLVWFKTIIERTTCKGGDRSVRVGSNDAWKKINWSKRNMHNAYLWVKPKFCRNNMTMLGKWSIQLVYGFDLKFCSFKSQFWTAVLKRFWGCTWYTFYD